jgi:hypothetical protein
VRLQGNLALRLVGIFSPQFSMLISLLIVAVLCGDTQCDSSNCIEAFEPSEEFQEVLPGQVLPKGLEIKINLQTGQKEARLPQSKQDSLLIVKEQPKLAKITTSEEKPQKPLNAMEIDELEKLVAVMLNNSNSTSALQMMVYLQDIVDEIDIGIQFSSLPAVLDFFAKNIQSRNTYAVNSAWLIGVAASNNPLAQKNYILNNFVQILWSYFSDTFEPKALFAISSLVRSNEQGVSDLAKLDPESVLFTAAAMPIRGKVFGLVADLHDPDMRPDSQNPFSFSFDIYQWCKFARSFEDPTATRILQVMAKYDNVACSKRHD